MISNPKTDESARTLGVCYRCGKAVERRATICRKHSDMERRARTRARDYSRKPAIKAQQKGNYLRRALDEGKILPPDTPLIYDGYKEPLKTVAEATGDGYGYMGTIATSEDRNHIQCHVCGFFFMSMANHLRTNHGMTAREYKEKYGLRLSTALIGESTRDKLIASKRMVENGGKLRPGLVKYNQDVKAGRKKYVRNPKGHWTLEMQNKGGYCPDQILEKITSLATELGRTPSYDEYRAHYAGRYIHPIKYHFGSWNNAVKMAGMTPVGEAHKLKTTREQLIKYLQAFYEQHGRVPMNSDFKRGIVASRHQYVSKFGTLNAARLAAGIPAVIPMPGRRYLEISPEDYVEYERLRDALPTNRLRKGALTVGMIKEL